MSANSSPITNPRPEYPSAPTKRHPMPSCSSAILQPLPPVHLLLGRKGINRPVRYASYDEIGTEAQTASTSFGAVAGTCVRSFIGTGARAAAAGHERPLIYHTRQEPEQGGGALRRPSRSARRTLPRSSIRMSLGSPEPINDLLTGAFDADIQAQLGGAPPPDSATQIAELPQCARRLGDRWRQRTRARQHQGLSCRRHRRPISSREDFRSTATAGYAHSSRPCRHGSLDDKQLPLFLYA